MGKLDGRVVAITGAARGIGLATTKRMQAEGASVAIGDIDAGQLETALFELGGDRVVGFHLDVTDNSSFEAFLGDAEAALGPLDVLVNNAGIMPVGPFLDEPLQLTQRTVEINLLGCLTGAKLALPGMVDRGSGHLVNVASIAGRAPVPGGATYAATKAAIFSLTESLRVEFARTGVAFTCIQPSFTATDLISGTRGTKMLKTAQPDDVAAAIVRGVAKRRPDVFVPRVLGPMVKLQGIMGRRLRDASQRSIGAYDTFLEVDDEARASYEERIKTGGPT